MITWSEGKKWWFTVEKVEKVFTERKEERRKEENGKKMRIRRKWDEN